VCERIAKGGVLSSLRNSSIWSVDVLIRRIISERRRTFGDVST
jgi:hypothetical protein